MTLTDAEYEEQKARFNKVLDYWWNALDMDSRGFVVKFQLEREGNQIPQDGGSWQTFMDIHTTWAYQQAVSNVYLPEIATLDDHELEVTLVHELMHVLVNEMRNDPKLAFDQQDGPQFHEHEERVVTGLSRSIVHLRNSLLAAPQSYTAPVESVQSQNPSGHTVPSTPAEDPAVHPGPQHGTGPTSQMHPPIYETNPGLLPLLKDREHRSNVVVSEPE